jgi:hypothetical protein
VVLRPENFALRFSMVARVIGYIGAKGRWSQATADPALYRPLRLIILRGKSTSPNRERDERTVGCI